MKRALIFVFLLLYAGAGFAQNADAISGVWWNDEKTTKISIEKKDGKYIGTIMYLIPSKMVNGQSPLDDKNPDASLRKRPLIGLQILSGFEYNTNKKEWSGGKIYDPKAGKTYDAFARMNGEVLKLKGFVAGIRALGRETEWYRATL